jgi:hypothetical protein
MSPHVESMALNASSFHETLLNRCFPCILYDHSPVEWTAEFNRASTADRKRFYLLLIWASAPAFEQSKFGCGYESAFISPAAE